MLIYAVPVAVIIYFVKVGWKGGKGEVGTVEVVEVEQLRPLTVAMMGRNKVGVTTFYFYIHVLICIENMQQCCYIITIYHTACTVIFHIFTSCHKFRYHCDSPWTTMVRLLCLKSLLSL